MKRAAAIAVLCTGCITQRVVPPPGAPLAIPPKVEGPGNVVFDVPNEKAHVYAVQHAGLPEEALVTLCTTPCAVTLKPGVYTLRYTSARDPHLTSTGDVMVPPAGKILVRHQLGYERVTPSTVGFAGLTLGGVGLVGGVIGIISAASATPDPPAGSISAAVGVTMAIAGACMVGGAILLLHAYRGERQAGATTVVAY